MKWRFFFLIFSLHAMQKDKSDEIQKVPSLKQIAQDQVLNYIAKGKLPCPHSKKDTPEEVYNSLSNCVPMYYRLSNSAFDAIRSKGNLKKVLGLSFDVNLKLRSNWTFLHTAVCEAEPEIVQFLLDHQADINALNIVGYTPLHIACERGSTEIITLLLKYQCKINEQHLPFLNTPLHILAKNSNPKKMEKTLHNIVLLLRAGADLTRKNNMGNTPCDCATNPRIIQLLTNHESNNNE